MRPFASLLALALIAPIPALAQSAGTVPAPAAPTAPTTKVLAIGRVTGAFDAAARKSIMPNEVHDTVQLYLDGKIDQWFVRQDGKGVVFLLNATSEADAKQMLSKLPLVQAGRMEFDLMPLGPLTPLRYLMGAPAGATAK